MNGGGRGDAAAAAAGLPIVAGPVGATAVGNALDRAGTRGVGRAILGDVRQTTAGSVELRRSKPRREAP